MLIGTATGYGAIDSFDNSQVPRGPSSARALLDAGVHHLVATLTQEELSVIGGTSSPLTCCIPLLAHDIVKVALVAVPC